VSLAWLGLFLSLNQTAPVQQPLHRGLATEATAVVGVGKLTLTTIYVQPLERNQPALLSVGLGMRVF
jgi:hypothetical protein